MVLDPYYEYLSVAQVKVKSAMGMPENQYCKVRSLPPRAPLPYPPAKHEESTARGRGRTARSLRCPTFSCANNLNSNVASRYASSLA